MPSDKPTWAGRSQETDGSDLKTQWQRLKKGPVHFFGMDEGRPIGAVERREDRRPRPTWVDDGNGRSDLI
ncbi:MAG: hypothetical protein A2700_02535 [Candidatus Blackburnbacteria bacterium RIFCSPHIGHO2_01_FULL_44_64]|uniref:Uncharacterized protein n=1 Tax=Candidatus Blackburnbacteria bacterium RIFCSPHIGHO2_02_FULL_44_20 TaxID=1797516 RepID=A0A1G1V975_9BACT|nr:MAG: hypothetical protein A2700_02535 [Candidatus Blackburnbacteria bacterium RIFCSPHIGHO2_01_FULL_44_64]OGY11803.1 MAG: hypothetical protein A3E16_00590 [Candidatus Blackburnbacteria bacterium RIFCSPHIGHO2_12_FULL_44_25]OGY11851.1 MAG: hypothetical protein A3D26_01090 [Candidatus Blackburnbacteria bacterium RIFCSPHIGHO2_02_FULL_44_20]OGY14459.1 MAG: hypothetical protein A3A62_00280 [Candidatus Blackburnbacteria bacterium RIFCSPLOWO2_01_FULL_44_43]OGY15826.1 MAG: hypothetical protein A3H88_0